MKLKLVSINGNGDFDKEHVLLKALDDCDVGRYMLADSTYTASKQVSNKLRHIFWFPDKTVKKDDLISVWTKSGNDTTSKTDSGTPVHRFFWNLKTAVWNDEGDCGILFEIADWKSLAAGT